MSITTNLKRTALGAGTVIAITSLALGTVSALQTTASSTTSTSSSSSSTSASSKAAAQTANQQQHLTTIKTKGAQEISRRLASLNKASTAIANSAKLNSSAQAKVDQAKLSGQVSDELSGLNTLQTTLAGETTLSAAITDAQSIYTDYRVYALLLPKIRLEAQADGEMTTVTNLTTVYNRLQPKVTAYTGSNQAALESDLTDMASQYSAAQNVASGVETSITNLSATDYDTNHNVLSGYATQLKTAHADNLAARNDANTVIAGLKLTT